MAAAAAAAMCRTVAAASWRRALPPEASAFQAMFTSSATSAAAAGPATAAPGAATGTRPGPAAAGGPRKRLGLAQVEHIVAITSAKGGVGKSTTAANLAVALATSLHKRVGLIDADVLGPSIHKLMNLSGKPRVSSEGPQPLLLPKENYRVAVMSFGFFIETDEAVMWRGPMVSNAFDKMLFGTEWGPLDVLVVDMPPGTGDAQINLAQRIPLSAAVVVSTPQDVALMDARRGAAMFRQLRVPLLGMVENMSFYQCKACGHQEHVFGSSDGIVKAAADFGVDLLAQVPLDPLVSARSDAGTPIVVTDPSSPTSAVYRRLAEVVMEKLQEGAVAKPSPPRITVE